MNPWNRNIHTALIWSQIMYFKLYLDFEFNSRCSYHKLNENITNADIPAQRLV